MLYNTPPPLPSNNAKQDNVYDIVNSYNYTETDRKKFENRTRKLNFTTIVA